MASAATAPQALSSRVAVRDEELLDAVGLFGEGGQGGQVPVIWSIARLKLFRPNTF